MHITRRYLPDTRRQLEALRRLLAAPPAKDAAPLDTKPKEHTETNAA
jgi:hypothetical protein